MPDRLDYAGKLVIATPFYGLQGYSPYIASLVQTARLLERLGVDFQYWTIHSDSYVERARNTLCAQFLEDPNNTDLFFIDSDEAWDSVGFVRVLMAPGEIVAGSYRMKNHWEAWTASLECADGHPKGKLIGENQALLLADSAGAGFMRIKRSALERYKEAYPDLAYRDFTAAGEERQYHAFFECKNEDGMFKGEDFVFCKRWQQIGGDIWIEPNVTITHYGMSGFEGNLDRSLRGALNG